MALTEAGAKALALIARESADSSDMSHNDLVKWLSDAVQDNKPQCSWCYFVDFIGDGESGTVYFCCDGDLTSAPYTIQQSDAGVNVKIDMDGAVDVLQKTTYAPETDQDNPAVSMEAKVAAGLYTAGDVPLCERNIKQAEIDAAPAGSFAGKDKSFPILKKGDAKAAAASIGRAGKNNHPPAKLKANIKKIAKAKGLTGELPQTWKDEDKAAEAARVAEAGARHSKADRDSIQTIHDAATDLGADCSDDQDPESNDNGVSEANKGVQAMHDKAVTAKKQKQHDVAVKMGANCPAKCALGDDADASTESAAVEIVGDVIPLREGAVGQDGTAYLKLIQPGWGSCGFYPPEVLERDGPSVFKAGTLDFWDHQTPEQEAARPEGSLRDLASVLTEDARYDALGPKGPGLYAKVKVFEEFRQPLDDLAKHIGVSIRASGKAKEGKAPDGKSGRIIEQLTHGHSVDYVTQPGAGGEILQLFESARGRTAQQHQQESSDMTATEQTQLREALAEVKKLKERQATADAGGAVAEYFRTVNATDAIRERVTSRVLAGTIPLTETSELDRKKVKELAEAQFLDELAFLNRLNPQLVVGMGPSAASQQLTEAQRIEQKQTAKAAKKALKESDKRYASLMSNGTMGKVGRKILIEGRSAFDITYNSRLHGAVLTGGGGSLPQGLEA